MNELQRLTGNKKRGKSRLKPAPNREAIPSNPVAAYPGGADASGCAGITTEVATSSDGFFVIEYQRCS